MSSSVESSVFVGNLPNEATEEKLAEAFSAAGQVIRFRIMTDPATGNRKGFGFCDFTSAEAAQNALKNLNGLKFMGRDLRVSEAAPPGSGQSSSSSGGGGERSSGGGGGHGSGVQTQRQARDIDTALRELSVGEVYDILVEVKKWIQQDPDKARDVLTQRPVLAQALLKMQSQMGMLQTAPPSELSFAALNSSSSGSGVSGSSMMMGGGGMMSAPNVVMGGVNPAPYFPQGMISQPMQPQQQQQQQQPQYYNPMMMQPPPGGYPLPMHHVMSPMPPAYGAPPQAFSYPAPAPGQMANVGAIQQQQAQFAMQQQQILSQIYALSEAQIALLPPDERTRVMRIKETGRLV